MKMRYIEHIALPLLPTMHPWAIHGEMEVVLSSMLWLVHSTMVPVCCPVQGRIIPTGPFPLVLAFRATLS